MNVNIQDDGLRIAVRAYPLPTKPLRSSSSPKKKHVDLPDDVLVFDCETRIDAQQSLMIGSYRFFQGGRCTEEGLFHGKLTQDELETLHNYAKNHAPDVAGQAFRRLRVLTRREFLNLYYVAAIKGRFVVVNFNLPFDHSRLAFKAGEARGQFAGGFSLALWERTACGSVGVEHPFRPRLTIKHIDSKRALKGFRKSAATDRVDQIPEGSLNGDPVKGYGFSGHLVDARTLAFALTDRGHSLDSACEAFGVDNGKLHVEEHGRVTDEYIDYNRRDVEATGELYFKLIEEYRRHPIQLQATKAYSPASIGKAYLSAMGIKPILERQPDFPTAVLGNTMSAFYGGRTGTHIRRCPVPIVYCDFLSMYPTVNTLMGLWQLFIASRIDVVDATEEIRRFVSGVKLDDLFDQTTWKRLTGFVQLIPDDDILPARAPYDPVAKDLQVGVNHIGLASCTKPQELWYSLPDVVASVLLTRRIPRINRAILLKPVGRQRGLKPVILRGQIRIDPRVDDFFKVSIEQRQLLKGRTDLSETERGRLSNSLKVITNATSYGILAEIVTHELGNDRREQVTVHGIDDEAFTCSVASPESAGQFCFPPLAALITGAARLNLTLLERCVTDLGSTNAMEDTDSMGIVATEAGGLVACPGGSYRTNDGREAVKALTWAQVDSIIRRFEALNPYDRKAVPGSILKIEDDNFDPISRAHREIHCFSISAKRYALFLKKPDGEIQLLQKDVNNKRNAWSEHGLGHLLNPSGAGKASRDWIRETWIYVITEELQRKADRPIWFDRPALSRISMSSPALMRSFRKINDGKPYNEQVKPFNFLLSAHLSPDGRPSNVAQPAFHLIAPYEPEASKWLKIRWIDQYSGNLWKVSTLIERGTKTTARLATYGDLIDRYAFHPESKSAQHGVTCAKQTIGLLSRRRVNIASVAHIGKESNRLEDVETGMISTLDAVITEYTDPNRNESSKVLEAILVLHSLRQISAATGICRSTLQRLRNSGTSPQVKTVKLLQEFAESIKTRTVTLNDSAVQRFYLSHKV